LHNIALQRSIFLNMSS